jgi:phosphatidylethanolamine-binding protein (PEBP) family uncharacterized protein
MNLLKSIMSATFTHCWSTLRANAVFRLMATVMFFSVGLNRSTHAQDTFILSSPAIRDGATLPAELKCTRDGGDGLSPPLQGTLLPEGIEALAVIMHHYPRSTVKGVDAPSQYWLLWNVPLDTEELPRGNPATIGHEGSDKDGRRTGDTTPCSRPGAQHTYTITLYALSGPLDTLPMNDDIKTDWTAMTTAMEGKIISSSYFSFFN